jgi:hypothetical protein
MDVLVFIRFVNYYLTRRASCDLVIRERTALPWKLVPISHFLDPFRFHILCDLIRTTSDKGSLGSNQRTTDSVFFSGASIGNQTAPRRVHPQNETGSLRGGPRKRLHSSRFTESFDSPPLLRQRKYVVDACVNCTLIACMVLSFFERRCFFDDDSIIDFLVEKRG